MADSACSSQSTETGAARSGVRTVLRAARMRAIRIRPQHKTDLYSHFISGEGRKRANNHQFTFIHGTENIAAAAAAAASLPQAMMPSALSLPSSQLPSTSASFSPRHHSHRDKPSPPLFFRRRHRWAALRPLGAKAKELVFGNPSVTVEKGKYSYDVETLINKLSSLPPRGSIARCLDACKNKLSLNDFALVFKEFAQRGDWQRSLRLFKYMQRQLWCKPNDHISTIMIGILGREGLLDKALEVFDEMPAHGVAWSVFSFTAIINAYGRNGHYQTALDLLHRMKTSERIPPAIFTYNSVINACARGGLDWEGLLSLFAEMRHQGIQPDLVTYNTLLSACAVRGLGDEAEMILRTMNEAGVTPDITSHAYLVETFRKLGRLGKVSELLAEMESEGNLPDANSYNVLLEAHARSGSMKEAMDVFRQMQAAGCTLNATTYSILLSLYGRNGHYDNVRELFLEMKMSSTEPDAATYNILIQVFGEGGYFKEVVTLFHDMVEENVEPNMETYEGLIFACGKGGLHEDAKKILLHMNSRGLVPSSKAYTGVVEAYGQASLYEEALVAFNTMNEVGSRPTVETYNSLAHTFARGGLYKESQAILWRMNEAGIARNTDSFNGLIEAFSQSGQFEDALKAYFDMEKTRCNPDEQTLEALLRVYCSAGLVEECRERFLEVKESGIVPSITSYCLLLSVYAKSDSIYFNVPVGKREDPLNRERREGKGETTDKLGERNKAGKKLKGVEKKIEERGRSREEEMTKREKILSIEKEEKKREKPQMNYEKETRLEKDSKGWTDAYALLEEMKTSSVSNTLQVIGSMIKGDYDDNNNWQVVEYIFDEFNSLGVGWGLRFYNSILESLWWLGQKERAARVLHEATKRGLFPELYRQSKLVWSVDVHRMSTGGALTAISFFLSRRGDMEKSSITRGFPVAKAAYSFLKDDISSSFCFPGWNKGRVICQRTQLKRVFSSPELPEDTEDLIPLTNSAFPCPGTRIFTREDGSKENLLSSISEKAARTGSELLATAA
ncbi:Pentatricopeptide repeat-containing protein, chloroplastic [Asimina triloba]